MKPAARSLTILLLLSATYTIAYNGDLDGNLDFFHEGERLAHMDKLWSGALPFRDIYVQHGLGEDILKPALACKLWGHSVTSLRRLGQNAYLYRGYLPPIGLVATLLAIFALTRSLAITTVSAICLVTCWCEITDRHVLGMLAISCAGCFLHSQKARWIAAAGCLSTLAALYSLEVGLYSATAILGWLLLVNFLVPQNRNWRNPGLFLAEAFLPAAVFLIWCAGHGIAGDFFHNVYCQLFMRADVMATSYPSLAPGAGTWILLQRLLLYYVLPLSYCMGVILSVRRIQTRHSARDSAVLLASLLGVVFWISVWGRPDVWHVAYAVGPFIVFAAAMISAAVEFPDRGMLRIAMLSPLVCCVAALALIGSGGAVGRRFGQSNIYLPPNLRVTDRELVPCPNPRLTGLRIDKVQAAFVSSLVEYIHQHSQTDETILDLSDFGLIYFLAGRQSPTRFDMVFHVGQSPLRAEMAREIRSRSALPAVVIRPDEPLRSGDVLDDLVARYYVSNAKIGTLELWLRAERPPQ